MRALNWAIIVLIGIIVLIMIGLLAGQVGGVAIRRADEASSLVLNISEPVLRGVPVTVHWDTAAWPPEPATLTFDWRDEQKTFRLGGATVSSGEVTVTFPCATKGATGSFVVRAASNEKVILSQPLTLGPPGAECVQ